jgi:Skp family chaperone for outer membrane proteins
MFENIKNFFKKSWGYLVAGLGVVFGVMLFRKKVDHYENIVQKLQDSHQKQLDEIEAARKEERKKHEENERKYQERMALIEKEYEAAKAELDEKKRKEIEGIVKKYGNQPDKLAQRLADVTGFKIIMPED